MRSGLRKNIPIKTKKNILTLFEPSLNTGEGFFNTVNRSQTVSAEEHNTVGTIGLSWSQIKKRPRDAFHEIWYRIKNDKPFVLLGKHRESEDGVYIYFNRVVIWTPSKVNGKWKVTDADKVINNSNAFYPKQYQSYQNFLKAIRTQTGVDFDQVKYSGEGKGRFPADAVFQIQFMTPAGSSPRQTINSSWLLKDGKIYSPSRHGIGGATRSQATGVAMSWGKLGWVANNIDTSYTLNEPTATEKGEADFISDFNQQLEQIADANGGRGLNVKIGGTTFDNIVGVNKVAGTGKADLAFVAVQGGKLVEVCWASHKEGDTAKDFGQWGGFTKPKNLYNVDSTIKEFVDYCHMIVGIGKPYDFTKMSSGVTIGMMIEGGNYAGLRKYTVYGPEWQGSFGKEKCNVVLQGNPSLSKSGNTATLSMDGHLHEYPNEMTGDYEPVLMCIKKASTENILAGVGRADSGGKPGAKIQGARFVISPKGGRTVTHWVKKDRNGNLYLDPPVV